MQSKVKHTVYAYALIMVDMWEERDCMLTSTTMRVEAQPGILAPHDQSVCRLSTLRPRLSLIEVSLYKLLRRHQ